MRLIDADELKKAIDTYDKFVCLPDGSFIPDILNEPYVRLRDIQNMIDNAPTVETQIEYFIDLEKIKTDCLNCEKFERPQGQWLPNYTSQFMNPGRQCSLCGKIVEFSENYCPRCGAHMKGNNNE